MYEISKEFEFDYGHRVHNQVLNKEYSINTMCKCRHLHGHRGKVVVYLKSKQLNECGMVTDFNHLNWLKELIDNQFDHKFLLDKNDPMQLVTYIKGDNLKSREAIEDEVLGGINYVDFNPTSENLAKMFFEIVTAKMYKLGILCSKIEFYETPKSKSTYFNPHG
jgi:6-pyruvoyltetrahydropterin/6-carboxytetrahydropterin synthase